MSKPLNVLFISLVDSKDLESPGIYTDLLRCFRQHGHRIYTVSPYQKRCGKATACLEVDGAHMLHVRTGNITQSKNLIEKGIATLSLDHQYIRGIRKYFRGVSFDLVIYTTPPITLIKTVSYVKRRDGSCTYLLLKDIFPQNAADLGMLRTSGPFGLIYRYFRRKERHLYEISDRIGCMSEANLRYLCKHNPEIPTDHVEVCPNCIEPKRVRLSAEEKQAVREAFCLPADKTLFLYGGNLGKPQGIPFLISCLRAQNRKDIHFAIVGSGTEYDLLREYIQKDQPENVSLLDKIPRQEYNRLSASADVGMIFLDHRFTIPNFPSRLLSYLEAGIPVLAATDPNTDLGDVILQGGFGWWCESNDVNAFLNTLEQIKGGDLAGMGEAGYQYLQQNYHVRNAYETIMRSVVKNKG